MTYSLMTEPYFNIVLFLKICICSAHLMAQLNLQFVPFTSTLDPGFWHVLSQKKLDEFGLKEDAVNIQGFYANSELE